MVAGRADFPFAAGADDVARAVLIGAEERAATVDPFGLIRFGGVEGRPRPFGIAGHFARFGERVVVVGPIPIAAPLPDVARHVEEPVAVRGKLSDGCDPCETVSS